MKRYVLIVYIFMFFFVTISCSSNSIKKPNSSVLSLYIMDYDTMTKKAVECFNNSHKNVRIEVKSLVAIPANNLGSKLMYELNSGEGPDIILCEQNTLPNLSVFFNKGSFFDLNTFINNDKSFKKADYFEKVMEYGVYNNKKYVIPLSFKIDSLYTTKEILKKSGQGISSVGAGIDDFVKGSEKHIKTISVNSSGTGNNKYYISDISFDSLVQTTPTPFFDLVNKTVNFNSQDFGDLMDKYKSLSETTCPDIMLASPAVSNNLLSSDKAVFASMQAMGPRYAAEPYASFKLDIEPIIMPTPYADTTRHVIAKPEKYIGINSKCGNREAAYDFIKLMLSKNFQDIDIMEGIPVNREAYRQEKEKCLKGIDGYNIWKKGGCKNAGTLKELYIQLDLLVESIDRCWTTDGYLLNIVQNEVDNYIKSNSTKENTLKTIQEKVEAYLKSGIMIEASTENGKDETPTDPLKTVSLYYWNATECYVTNSIDEYNEKYPDIKIKKKTFDSYENFYRTVGVELMAGGGPDIIIFQPRFFNSINKAVESGAFCIMDNYIEKYNILNLNEYNTGILDGGVYNGKCYYIPLYYFHSPLLTTSKLLDENKIVIKDGDWTWDKFAEYSKTFCTTNSRYFSYGIGLETMLINSDVKFIDYKNKKSYFKSDQFKKLLRLYKEMYPSMDPNRYELKHIIESKNNVFFSLGGSGEATYFKILYDEVTDKGKEDMVAVPTPTLTGNFRVYAIPSDCIGVNSKCKNKDAAFKYVKIAASYEIQRDYDKRGKANSFLSSPVSNKAYSDDLLSYQTSGALPRLLVNSLINEHGLLKDCQIKDYSILETIVSLSEDYINDKKTEHQVVQEIDDKVNVFLNE